MPDEHAHDDTADLIVGRTLLAAETLAAELRESMLDRIERVGFDTLTPQHETEARAELDRFTPPLTEILTAGILAAGIAGLWRVWSQLPENAQDAVGGQLGFLPGMTELANLRGLPVVAGGIAGTEPAGGVAPTGPDAPVGQPPSGLMEDGLTGGDPIVRFPLIEIAAEELAERNAVTRQEFEEMADDARRRAFTFAQESSEEVIGRVRDTLSETIQEGASLEIFREKLGEELESSFIGPAHLENVYRTNIQSGFGRAHDQMADHPIVSQVFPYQEYLPIRDARTRSEHWALGMPHPDWPGSPYGLSGTAVYRRDDPMWDLFSPPWDFQCRCGVNLLTVEAAARRGVQEAIRWERTGIPPEVPEWRIDAIPFRPRPGWVSGKAAVA